VSQWGCAVVTVLNILKDWAYGKRYAIIIARLIFLSAVSVDDACMWNMNDWLALEKRGFIFRVPTCMVQDIVEAFLREKLRRVALLKTITRPPSLQDVVFDADGHLL